MQTSIALPLKEIKSDLQFHPILVEKKDKNKLQPGRLEKTLVWFLIKARIFYYACRILKHPKKIYSTYLKMLSLRNAVWAGDLKKMYKNDHRYYFNQYTPGWPSKAYDELIKSELYRHADPLNTTDRLSFVFLAITRKCPMRCEHCFEWDNLNQKESFTKEELLQTIDIYQKEGVLQFHFSGGEPMVRIKDLPDLVAFASKKSECWVLTSGFNFTRDNALKLKKAGCKGIVVSIDHYIPELHNIFRGNPDAFEMAVAAVREAKACGMLVSVSVCATRSFIDGGHLLNFMDFAHGLGVNYVQVLEPKDVGNYENKDVLLTKKHIDLLDTVFKKINHSKEFAGYPTMIYHGYHQRRVGCFSGSRSVYIDSAGDVHACPFCHTKAYNIIDLIRSGADKIPKKENECPRYEKIA